MSRDAFSYDPQERRRRARHVPRAARPAAQIDSIRHARQPGIRCTPNAWSGDSTEAREQHPRLARNAGILRARYYVRDRAYLLRDSEMHSLKEIGKFRVIAVSDLAKYAYGGNRERMEKDIRAARTAVSGHRQDR